MARNIELRVGDYDYRRDENGEYGLWPLGGRAAGQFFKYHPKHRHLFEGTNWCLTNGGHASGRRNGKAVLAHRLVLEEEIGQFEGECDHINRDRLDNRPCNLRAVTRSENLHNTGKRADNSSGVLGVSWAEARGKWMACVKLDGKNIHLGLFTDIELAAIAADFGRIHYHNNSLGDINNEGQRDLYVSILEDHGHLFQCDVKPCHVIKVLVDIFLAETTAQTGTREVTECVADLNRLSKEGKLDRFLDLFNQPVGPRDEGDDELALMV